MTLLACARTSKSITLSTKDIPHSLTVPSLMFRKSLQSPMRRESPRHRWACAGFTRQVHMVALDCFARTTRGPFLSMYTAVWYGVRQCLSNTAVTFVVGIMKTTCAAGVSICNSERQGVAFDGRLGRVWELEPQRRAGCQYLSKWGPGLQGRGTRRLLLLMMMSECSLRRCILEHGAGYISLLVLFLIN